MVVDGWPQKYPIDATCTSCWSHAHRLCSPSCDRATISVSITSARTHKLCLCLLFGQCVRVLGFLLSSVWHLVCGKQPANQYLRRLQFRLTKDIARFSRGVTTRCQLYPPARTLKCCLCSHVCLDVNQVGTNRNRCIQGLVILHAQNY